MYGGDSEAPPVSTVADGETFAAALYGIVHNYGPRELAEAEREELGSYLLRSAIEWVRQRNLSKASPQ